MERNTWKELADSVRNSSKFDFGFIGKTYVPDYLLVALEKKVEFFLNSKLEPMLKIHEDRYQQEWKVSSERVRDLLMIIYYEITQGDILTKREGEFFNARIREKCRKGEMRFSKTEIKEAEEDPIVSALLYFMNDNEYFDGRTVDLLELLQQTPFVKTGSKRNEIPPYTNIFSRKLNELTPILLKVGIEVTMQHRDSGSWCRIYRANHFRDEPDPENTVKPEYTLSEPSVVNANDTNDLQQPDGSDDTDDDFSYSDQPSVDLRRDSRNCNRHPEPDD